MRPPASRSGRATPSRRSRIRCARTSRARSFGGHRARACGRRPPSIRRSTRCTWSRAMPIRIRAARTSDAFLAFDMDTGKLLWSRQLTEGDAFNLGCPTGRQLPGSQGTGFRFRLFAEPGGSAERQARADGGAEIGHGACARSGSAGRGVVAACAWAKAGRWAGCNGATRRIARKSMRRFRTISRRKNLNEARRDVRAETGDWREGVVHAARLRARSRNCSPAQSAAVTVIPGVVFSGSLDGHLRAYSTADGQDRLGRGYGHRLSSCERRERPRAGRWTVPGRWWWAGCCT